MQILNLTQHPATPEQVAAGVVDPEPLLHGQIKRLLTFDRLPKPRELAKRAHMLALLSKQTGMRAAMIGGAPWLMSNLEEALRFEHIVPVYAFSERITEETVEPDGSVRKISTFRHAGFVFACEHDEARWDQLRKKNA
jgi:hypothetical protein